MQDASCALDIPSTKAKVFYEEGTMGDHLRPNALLIDNHCNNAVPNALR